MYISFNRGMSNYRKSVICDFHNHSICIKLGNELVLTNMVCDSLTPSTENSPVNGEIEMFLKKVPRSFVRMSIATSGDL